MEETSEGPEIWTCRLEGGRAPASPLCVQDWAEGWAGVRDSGHSEAVILATWEHLALPKPHSWIPF